MRQQMERLAAVDGLAKLAKSGKMVLSGEQGKNLLSAYTDALDDITSNIAI